MQEKAEFIIALI